MEPITTELGNMGQRTSFRGKGRSTLGTVNVSDFWSSGQVDRPVSRVEEVLELVDKLWALADAKL